jgi:uncharacterized membrane protein
MQTREPKKRVNWIFVFVLIITIPLVVFGIFMMNTIPARPPVTSSYDSMVTRDQFPDSILPDTSTRAWKDSSLKNN